LVCNEENREDEKQRWPEPDLILYDLGNLIRESLPYATQRPCSSKQTQESLPVVKKDQD